MLTTPAIAQDIFEEIIVTAQRRDQNIMEVPVAVTAVTGAQIEESGITDMFELQQNVPGLIVGQSQTATTSNFAIRGIGSTANNFGVESSVGLYVDEVYRSRQSSIINELVDINAVEVLRGPQGTLFGKNTPAGAILIRTVAPSTDSSAAFIQATAGDFGLFRISGATNIPINDELAFRATVFSSQRDGYVDDDNFGSDFHNDRDRFGVRLQLGWEPSDTFDMRIIADYAEVDETCCVAVSRVDSLWSRASLAGAPVVPQNGTDAVFLGLGGTVYTDYPYPQPFLDALAPLPGTIVTGVGFDEFRTSYDSAPISKNEDSGLSLAFNKTFDNGMVLSSISAYRSFDTFDSIDGDFSDTPIFVRTNESEQSSFSQEFRLSGEFGDGGNWVTGVYYFGQEISNLTVTDADLAFNPYVLATNPDLVALIAGTAQVLALLPPGTLPPQVAPYSADSIALNDFNQDQDGYAIFGQVDFPLGDKFQLTLGARYTDETKRITGIFTDSSVGPPPDIAAMQAALFAASQGDFSQLPALLPILQPNVSWGNYLLTELSPRPNINTKLEDDKTTGTAKLTWFVSDESMLYASYATGFKSGGTNTDRIDPSIDTIFSAEDSTSIELGYKAVLGPVRFSAALYQTDFDDFQANTFTGTGFNLQNAGEVEISGFEIEGTWRPTDNLELQAFYAHNEAEYKSFPVGTCWTTTPFHTGLADPAPPGPDPVQCDRTGDPLPYNPEDRAFVAATQNFAVGNNNLWIRAEWSYASSQFTDGDLDPLTEQDSFSIVNLRLGLDIDSWNSTLTLWGRNITDERWYHGSFDAPIQLGRMNSYPSEPATYGVTFQMNFD
jgi:outer membrane receptor protein involved in Fe transport